MNATNYQALVKVASAFVGNTVDHDSVHSSFGKVDDWHAFAELAEQHGLSVMLGQLAKTEAIAIPRELDLQLKALTIRHQKVLAAREQVLSEMIDTFEQHDITFALLKGAALAQLIYEPAWLRPMRDIDIIVKKPDAARAQELLRTIGFVNEDLNMGYLFEHHHLPNSTRELDGFTISLEVHHDALSGDADASIKLDALDQPLQSFPVADKTAYAFGHADMLKHLKHHTFEPAEIIKLGSIIDLVRYANIYAEDIDWKNTRLVGIVNALRCIDTLVTLPEPLKSTIGGPFNADWQPAGVGEGFIPLSKIHQLTGRKNKLSALLLPSEWWLHIFYDISPMKSPLATRLFRHPVTLTKWLFRRYNAARKSRAEHT